MLLSLFCGETKLIYDGLFIKFQAILIHPFDNNGRLVVILSVWDENQTLFRSISMGNYSISESKTANLVEFVYIDKWVELDFNSYKIQENQIQVTLRCNVKEISPMH